MHGSNLGQGTTTLRSSTASQFLHADAGTEQGEEATVPSTCFVIHPYIIIAAFDII
jgi:hypothetical protein